MIMQVVPALCEYLRSQPECVKRSFVTREAILLKHVLIIGMIIPERQKSTEK
jgi:hypothetical protein